MTKEDIKNIYNIEPEQTIEPEQIQEVVIVTCYVSRLEEVINKHLDGYQNILDIKIGALNKYNTPYYTVIAKKTEHNKGTRRDYTGDIF